MEQEGLESGYEILHPFQALKIWKQDTNYAIVVHGRAGKSQPLLLEKDRLQTRTWRQPELISTNPGNGST